MKLMLLYRNLIILGLYNMSKKQSHYIQLDLIILLLAFISISVLAIYNAQQLGQYPGQNFASRQLIYFGIGILLLILLQFVDTEILYKSSVYLYIFGVLIVVLLHFSPASIAEPGNRAKSWFNRISFITIQPSEITKIAIIDFLAILVVKHNEKYKVATAKSNLRSE